MGGAHPPQTLVSQYGWEKGPVRRGRLPFGGWEWSNAKGGMRCAIPPSGLSLFGFHANVDLLVVRTSPTPPVATRCWIWTVKPDRL